MAIFDDVTRESVLAAIHECDQKGRDQFLNQYGYGRSRSYPLFYEGKEYDSKAILLVACRYQHPEAGPLPHNAFTGGIRTVVPHLRKLGFDVPTNIPIDSSGPARVKTELRVEDATRIADSVGVSEEAIASRLIDHAEKLYKRSATRVRFSGNVEADDLLNDIAGHPHAFVTAAVMDRQVKAELAWMIPHRIRERHGTFEFRSLARLTESDFIRLFQNPDKLHRFYDTMAKLFYETISRISDIYRGDATRIWSDEPTSALLVGRFLEFKGVGPKIATMATNILVRDFKVPVKDRTSIDISPDVQIRRVLGRLGLVRVGASNNELIYKARELNPTYPGIIDLPVWEIGREWCRPANPDCGSCYMESACPKVGVLA